MIKTKTYVPWRNSMYAIETKDLTKFYGKSRGIENVNLTVEKGDMFGFIGPNGAGKSTTIRLLLGLIKPSKGEAKIFEGNCFKDTVEINKRIGYMPSEVQFYIQLKVMDVINLAAKLRKQDCKEEAMKLCDRFQLDIQKKLEDLSLGNRKKVSIVCALQHNPELIILDEPTSGLDPLMQKEFFDVLEERNKQGATVFFSSHVLPEIQNHCKKAAIIRNGKIIKSAPVSELTATSAKSVTLINPKENIVSYINKMSAVKNVSQDTAKLQFLYNGEIAYLLHSLDEVINIDQMQKGFTDMTITEPGLEEIFMHYYE